MKNLLEKADTLPNSLVIPKHIAIIMDGNRRWAKNKSLPVAFGHKQGVESIKKISKYADKLGVSYLTLYAFSTENWNRKQEEVNFLMYLIKEVIENEIEEMHKENVKLKIIGFYKELPKPLPEILDNAQLKTKDNTGLNLQVAINYGSRAEITYAIQKIVDKVISGEINKNEITPELISQNLLTSELPDPDLLIRTGGEQRISNYLLWQSAYTEFYSAETLWPDFDTKELDKAIEEFSKRQRRYGT